MRHTLWEVAPPATMIRTRRRRSEVAEDKRFELLRGCPQHAFQQCWPAFTSVRHRPRPARPRLGRPLLNGGGRGGMRQKLRQEVRRPPGNGALAGALAGIHRAEDCTDGRRVGHGHTGCGLPAGVGGGDRGGDAGPADRGRRGRTGREHRTWPRSGCLRGAWPGFGAGRAGGENVVVERGAGAGQARRPGGRRPAPPGTPRAGGGNSGR